MYVPLIKTIMLMQRLLLLATTGLFTLLLACQSTPQRADDQSVADPLDTLPPSDEPAKMAEEVAALPAEQMEQMVAAYLDVKNALVQSDPALASTAAEELAKATGGRQDEVLTNLREAATRISDSQDLTQQRQAFEALSGKMYILAKASPDHPTLYRQYCPMAFDNQGAYWLAAEAEINNPYFGDKMLRCGSVEEEL